LKKISRIAASLNDLGRQHVEENDDRLKHLHLWQNELQTFRKEIESELIALGLKPPSRRVAAFFDFLERASRYLFKKS
jgi:hypothetical protein